MRWWVASVAALVVGLVAGAAHAESPLASPAPSAPVSGGWADMLAARDGYAARGDDKAVIAEIIAQRDRVYPPLLLEAARRLAASAPDKAAYYFTLGAARMRYDALRCTDETALSQVGAVIETLPGDRTALAGLADAELAKAAKKLKRDGAAFKGTASPWWICSGAAETVYAMALSGQEAPPQGWLKPEAAWAEARTQVDAYLTQSLERARGAKTTPSP